MTTTYYSLCNTKVMITFKDDWKKPAMFVFSKTDFQKCFDFKCMGGFQKRQITNQFKSLTWNTNHCKNFWPFITIIWNSRLNKLLTIKFIIGLLDSYFSTHKDNMVFYSVIIYILNPTKGCCIIFMIYDSNFTNTFYK